MRRRIFFTIAALLTSLSVNAQLTGNGSITSPYSGTLAGNLTITGTKYFNGNIIVDNETMMFSPGAKFISTSTSACIRVTGTGKLYAVGSSTSPILFSVDIDKDLNNGETGEKWGDIYITSAGVSTLTYCTIENGTRTDPRLGSSGGGIYISTSSVALTYCTIRNCMAIKGGGIYIASGHSPTITSTLLVNNTATENGGGAYISSSASPVFANVIFKNNTSTSATLNGGALASYSGSPVIVNSTFVYNTSSSNNGNDVYLENSTSAKIVNTIIWGGSNHIALSGTPSSVFSACAIEGAAYAGCLELSSLNADPAGPNFTDPVSGNFSIVFDSPLRDAGVNTFSGVTMPATDFIGTKRVGNFDVGAYEMLYSRWVGSATTDWARPVNWDKSYGPGTTRNIIIPAGVTNFPTLTPGPSFSLSAGLKMIVEAGAKVTFSSLTNNGTVILEANETSFASVITSAFSGAGGSLKVKQYVTGGEISPDLFRWHYIAPPVTVDKSVVTAISDYNLMMYDESKITTNVSQGWQWHDGYDGTTAFSDVVAKKGYLIYFPKDTILIYDNLKSMTTDIGQIDLPFSGSGLDTSLYGYSCIGNSLTCAINWDLVTLSDPVNLRNAIYIQKGDVVASYVNGVGTNGGTAHISPLQGFTVKTRAVGTYITIPATAKEHDFTTLLKSEASIPLMRLSLSSEKGKDETVLRLDHNATLKFDGNFDADKITSPKILQIFTSLSGENYSINSIPWPDTYTEIPLVVMIPLSGSYKISQTEMQQLGSEKIWLTDHTTNSVIDLTTVSDYTFISDAGKFLSRFTLTVSDSYPGKSQPVADKTFKLLQSEGSVILLPEGEKWNGERCTVKIYDISGRVLMTQNEEYLFDGERKDYYINKPNGLLIVEVTTDGNKYFQKIVVNP